MIRQSFIIPIIKVTDSCNYACDFCYYAQRHLNGELMSTDLCKKIIHDCFVYNVEQGNYRMRVIFHGGEPLLQPISFYKEMIAYERELSEKYNGFEFFNSIQTNGYFLNQKWMDFLYEESFDIGISLDGPNDLNCHYGKGGLKESTDKVLNNIKLLNERKIPFGLISVITNKHTSRAKEIYQFCVDNEIHDLSLNYCYNLDTDDTVKNENLIPFLREMFDLYFTGEFELNIREFNEMIAKIMGYCTDTCATCERRNCGQYISFDYVGNVFFCDSGYDKKSSIGNLKSESLYEIIDSSKYLKKIVECRNVFDTYCKKCNEKEWCGGGCHRYDICSGEIYNHNYFCPTHRDLSNYIKNKIDNCQFGKEV